MKELSLFTERKIYVHGAVANLSRCYENEGVTLGNWEAVSEADSGFDFSQSLILAPPSAASSTGMRRFKKHETAFASGWMRVRGNRRRRGHDRGLIVSDHSDWPSLIKTVEETKAKQILVTHGDSDHLVRYLNEKGIQARPLKTSFT